MLITHTRSHSYYICMRHLSCAFYLKSTSHFVYILLHKRIFLFIVKDLFYFNNIIIFFFWFFFPIKHVCVNENRYGRSSNRNSL